MTEPTLEPQWRRLHPLTILRELGSLAWAFVAAFLLDFDFMQVPEEAAGPEVIIAVGAFGYAVTRYLFTAYRVTDQALELRRGVLVKTFQSMPRDRVQSVGATTGIIGRLAGVTTVEVSAADAKDIQLAYVSEPAADQLRRVLQPARQRVPSIEGSESGSGAEPLADLDVGRLMLFGLTEAGLIPALVLLGLSAVLTVGLGWVFAPFLALTFGAWPILRTTALAGFRSWVEDDRLRVQAGIVGRRRTEAPLERIQALQVSRPPLRRLLGFETVGIVTGDIAVSSENAVAAGIVAPLEPVGAWRAVSERLLGHVAMGEAGLERSSRYAIRRAAIRGLALVALVVGVLVVLILWLQWPGWIALATAVIGAAAALLYARARWRVLGWAVDERHLLVRRGVLTRHLTVVPVHKVQDVTMKATFFQRRLGLATVEVDTAGSTLAGNVRAVDLATDRARFLADHLAAVAARIALPDGV